MKKIFILTGLGLFIFSLLSFQPENGIGKIRKALNDSLEHDRAKYIALIREQIKGKEQMMVDSVFINLKVLGGFPAENLVFAMDAWSKGLGVSCGHCHNTTNFASDEIQKKSIAREMVQMGNIINQKLKSIEGLSKRPVINCITCHRGELKPALSIKLN